MSELRKFVIGCKNAIAALAGYIEYNKIRIPVEIGLDEIREWFLVMQGYAECMEEHDLMPQEKGCKTPHIC